MTKNSGCQFTACISDYSAGTKMLDLEVIPGRSLGSDQWEFILGMTFGQVVNILRRQCRLIKDIHMIYCDQQPLSMDMILNLTQDGIKLIFDSVSQRLKIIEIYNLSKVKLKYCGKHFNSPQVQPNIEKINSSFGATRPAVYDATQQLFTVNFRGLAFLFPIPADARFEPNVHGLGSIPLPSKNAAHVNKIYIYGGTGLSDLRIPPIPNSCFCGNIFLEKAEAIIKKDIPMGMRFYLLADNASQGRSPEAKRQPFARSISFGDAVQDVISALGAPHKIFFKSEDKMKIHSKSFSVDKQQTSDYFFNYFTLGVDILLDASTHQVKKFILHGNFPGHYNFNIYHRCNFEIPLPNVTPMMYDPEADDLDLILTACSKWDSLSPYLVKSSQKPVVLNRSSHMNTTNPFGSTFCYGVRNMIVEVMPNHHVASVTIYDPSCLSSDGIDSP